MFEGFWRTAVVGVLLTAAVILMAARANRPQGQSADSQLKSNTIVMVYRSPVEKEPPTPDYLLWAAVQEYGIEPMEFPDIVDACLVNGCWSPDRVALLLAIRKQENGGDGLGYGIVSQRGSSYRVQAGWCAATISKNMRRWAYSAVTPEFIARLSRTYAPDDAEIWERNVLIWFETFRPQVENAWREIRQSRIQESSDIPDPQDR